MEDYISRLLSSLNSSQLLMAGLALFAAYMLLKDSFPQLATILKNLKDRFFPTSTAPAIQAPDVEPELLPSPYRVALLANLDEVYEYFDDNQIAAGKAAVRAAMAQLYADPPLSQLVDPRSPAPSVPLSH